MITLSLNLSTPKCQISKLDLDNHYNNTKKIAICNCIVHVQQFSFLLAFYFALFGHSTSWFKWITGYTGYWISTTISKLPLIYSSQSHVILGARGLGTVSGMSEVSKTFVWDHTSGEPGWIFLSPQRSYSAETLSGIFWQKVVLYCSICSSWTLEHGEKTLRQGR